MVGYLETLSSYLRKQALEKDIVCILAPGSVYWLTGIRDYCPKITASQEYAKWGDEKLRQWRQALDLIIWLDAPNELLLDRVTARAESHQAKNQSPKETLEEISRLRKGYGEIISLMTTQGGPRLLQFRTDQISPEQIADNLYAEAKLNAATSVNEG